MKQTKSSPTKNTKRILREIATNFGGDALVNRLINGCLRAYFASPEGKRWLTK